MKKRTYIMSWVRLFFLPCFFCSIVSASLHKPDISLYIPTKAVKEYTSNWYSVPVEAREVFEFHAQFGKILAETKLKHDPPDSPDNIAAFGISLRSSGDGKLLRSITLLPIVSSTIDQIKDPIISSEKEVIITVRDLLGEDILHKKFRAHKMLEMAEWLVPWEYTKDWSLLSLIQYEEQLIVASEVPFPEKDSLKRLTILKPVDKVAGKTAGDILHCEQVVVYKLLTDSAFLSNTILNLIDKLPELPPALCLDLEIVTFNDMCPKCFGTLFYRFTELKQKISGEFVKQCQLTKRKDLYHKLPLIFRILVSSIRPYKVETKNIEINLKTRECASCKENAIPCALLGTILYEHKPEFVISEAIPIKDGIFQFVNPWANLVFSGVREKYQSLVELKEQINAEIKKLQSLPASKASNELIERLNKAINPGVMANVKNVMSIDIATINVLIEESKKMLEKTE